ncbi:hypothetical protein OG979_41970 [Actinomadura citrea]|uniref:hypothetical protein n=1 Tax=Actinomadura citrea TaxID=46158 RepID=UPI002E294D8F|nr:hypothetical protein [Actinomadura citrea]
MPGAPARVAFHDAPFVILDEPTATLDARAEHGTHGSLMAAGGRYAEPFALQAEGYLDPAAIPGR